MFSNFKAPKLAVALIIFTLGYAQQCFAFELTAAALDAAWEKREIMCNEYIAINKQAVLPGDFEILWRIGRAVYYGGFFCFSPDTEDAIKEAHFKFGIDASEKAKNTNPKRVEGHYWFAVNYGGYGLAKGIRSSLNGAPIMRDSLNEAIKIDNKYNFAGAHRVLGRLYFVLPSLISFGDNKKALVNLQKAKELSPDNKLNYIYLAEVQKKEFGVDAALKTLSESKKLPEVAGSKEEKSYLKDIERLEKKWK